MSSEQVPHASSQALKSQRVLACVLCQQRKIKCDRKFPCSNCTKSRAQCVPATQIPRRRRRRFAERDLLDQLRKYEDLLRQNNIDFEPLHKEASNSKESPEEEQTESTEGSSPATTVKSEKIPEVKSFWHAVHNRFASDDDSDASGEDSMGDYLRKSMDGVLGDGSHILGLRQFPVDISPLHPEPAQIFRLWQLFLDNVNPLLRVVHTPTIQGCIIEAIGDITNIDPAMEALMFSIYSVAVFSINEETCLTTFHVPRSDLLTTYQFGCQQALANHGVLRCSDRNGLTALYLYMVSFTHTTDPRALSSIVAIAMRIAQRMRLDKEWANAEQDILEAEMRRRLWWALILFDFRICQIAGDKPKTMLPTYDCAPILNVNDAELRPEMKEAPSVHEQPTETIYAVVRVAMANYMRFTRFNIQYNAPELIPLARIPNGPTPEGGELVELEHMIETKYLRFCNPENPLQFTAIWEARSQIAKCRLMEDYARSFQPGSSGADDRLHTAVIHAIRLLECDTKLMTSPLTQGFTWMSHFNFPFPAYIHLVKYMKKYPLNEHAERAWQVISNNFESWSSFTFHGNNNFIMTLYRMILGAWSHRETALVQAGEMITPLPIITDIRNKMKMENEVLNPQDASFDWMNEGTAGAPGMGLGMGMGLSMSNGMFNAMPMNFAANYVMPTSTEGGAFGGFDPGMTNNIPTQVPLDANMDQLDWAASTMSWGVGQQQPL